MKFSFLSDPRAHAGFLKFVVLQFEMVWSSATVEGGLTAGEIRAGTSHPDFGKKWTTLAPTVQEFVSRLCILRCVQIYDLAHPDRVRLLNHGTGTVTADDSFVTAIATRFHDDWMALRALMYSPLVNQTREQLVANGLKPFGEHEGDKPWEAETPAQQQNDLRLVAKLGWLLNYCCESEDEDLQALAVAIGLI